MLDNKLQFSNSDMDFMRYCLSDSVNQSIICFGNLGLRDGIEYGVKVYSGKYGYSQLFYSSCDCSMWYVDKNFDLRYTGIHHDGTNAYLYRAIKDNLSGRQLENLFRIAMRKELSRAQLNRYTKPIGKEILERLGILS